jgi:hypothetical protein
VGRMKFPSFHSIHYETGNVHMFRWILPKCTRGNARPCVLHVGRGLGGRRGPETLDLGCPTEDLRRAAHLPVAVAVAVPSYSGSVAVA